jgi:hypothetical protein
MIVYRGLALRFDDNLKAINLPIERSLPTIHEDIEHVNKALDDLYASRNDHAKIIQDLGAQIDKVEARMDARGDASKDPGSVLECLHVSAAANSQEPKTSGRNKPADELRRNIILRRKCRPNRAKEGRRINQCILDGILALWNLQARIPAMTQGDRQVQTLTMEIHQKVKKQEKESRSNSFPGLKRIKTRNEIFSEALSYKTYRLNNQSQRYEYKVSRDLYSYCKKVNPNVPE